MTSVIATAEPNLEAPYRLQSVSQTLAPSGCEGTWYRYVIAQGDSLSTGMRSGTAAELDDFLLDLIERLNERRKGKFRPRVKPPKKSA